MKYKLGQKYKTSVRPLLLNREGTELVETVAILENFGIGEDCNCVIRLVENDQRCAAELHHLKPLN